MTIALIILALWVGIALGWAAGYSARADRSLSMEKAQMIAAATRARVRQG